MAKQLRLLFLLLLITLAHTVNSFAANSRSPQQSTNLIQTTQTPPIPAWQQLSTIWGDLPVPSASNQQTASVVADLDGDGINDFVIAIRRDPGPALVWYQRQTTGLTETGWIKHVIEAQPLPIEAGGAAHDIDGDGDLDLVMGGDFRSNQLWWWENPHPAHEPTTGWTRRLIKDGGANKHHDQIFGDFTGDGQDELIFWNQQAKALLMAEIPADPRQATSWPTTTIYQYAGIEHEGLAAADIDGNGVLDIVGGGRWFRFVDNQFQAQVIDDSQRFSRAATGQLVAGGAPEVIFVCGDCVGPLRWYGWDEAEWQAHGLLATDVDHGHTLEVGDVNLDGHLDLFVAEMRVDSKNAGAMAWLFLGDGKGGFVTETLTTGFGNHESRLADLDGDGDLDLLGKPYNWETPRLDLWLNQTNCGVERASTLNTWRRHVIDDDRPWRSLFVTNADVNGDGYQDVLTGAWWYANPGAAGGSWSRNVIGSALNNLATVADFDGDGDPDVLGTAGQGSNRNATFAWAQNDGAGSFTIHNQIATGNGDFLQGVVALPNPTGQIERVALSWHDESKPLQQLTLPAGLNETGLNDMWAIQQLSETTQGEELSSADIDRDEDLDLMLGTQWLRNDGAAGWAPFTLAPATVPTSARPDRHRLVDLNNDGRLDVVVGDEGIGVPARLAWYAQPVDATQPWTEHLIDEPSGPMSLDVRDMDGDGDWDLIVGEHIPNNRAAAGLYIYENSDGNGGAWQQHLVYRGDEHHDGAQTVDIDNDGDWDIISIGWQHDDVLLYENRANPCSTAKPTATPSPTPSPTPSSTTTTPATATATATIVGTTATPLPTSTVTPQSSVTPATPSPTATSQPTTTDQPPQLRREPADGTVYVGERVTFTVEVSGTVAMRGATELAFQWYRNDNAIPGATAASYILTAVTIENDGDRFYCTVTSAEKTVRSETVQLAVQALTALDLPHRAYLPLILSDAEE